MAGKSKFKIPTGEEMEKSTSKSPSISTMSLLFQNYREQKKNPTNTEQTNRKQSNTGNLEEKHSKSSSTSVRPSALGNSHPSLSRTSATGSVVQKSGTVTNGIANKPSFSGTKSTDGEKVNTAVHSSKAFGSKPASAPSSARDKITSDSTAGKESSESSTGGTSKAPSINSIIVNYRQRGNPILKHVRNVPWEYGSIVPDYVMGKANCALFLSLRYHQLNPTYIHNRLKELGKGYDLRVILVQVDVTDPHHLLKDLAKICILADCTLMVAFSVEEAGRYLETYKVYENKPPEALMEKTDTDYVSKLTDTLTTVKSVNKTDCMTLLSTFGSFEEIVKATKEDLSLCPGFGPQKAQRLYDVLHESFVKGRKRQKEEPSGMEPSPSTSVQHSPAKKPS